MPTSCQDLQCLGHAVNGFYLVAAKEKKQMETVYCNFDRSGSKKDERTDNSPSESRLGFVDVKKSPVYFYVQRNRGYWTTLTTIPWELAQLNIGNAINLETGVFTAPKEGVYQFHFSGISFIRNHFQITLRLNGVRVGYTIADSRASGPMAYTEYNTGTLHSLLKLKKGDQVDLWLHMGALYEDANHFTHFVGWLDEEHDLQL